LISGFFAAIAFLTRLPVGRAFTFDARQVARSQRWFPLAGALVGGLDAGALWLAAPHLPPLVAAILVLALDAWLTGAMHLDGLADTADGFGGGASREDVLRIMRDHAIGSYGAVALVLAVALKAAAIAALIGSDHAIPALIAAPVLGRWAAVLLSATQPYARPVSDDHPRSVGSPARFVGPTELVIATFTAIAAVLLCDLRRGAAAIVLVAAVSALWAWRCRGRIGGVTGDTIGAGIQASECMVLLVFTAVRG
jgi:adenosylcobinamide-GDP ribazoletransferase